MSKPFAVIFDMDGVIVDTNPFHKETINQFCKKYGFQLTDEELRTRIYGRTNREWITALFGKLTEQQLEAYAFEKEQMFREAYAAHIKPVEGLISFLEMLEQNHIVRSIATSAPRANVDFVLKGTGIGKYFNIILDESMVSHGKPHPEIYLKSAKALNLPNQQCIVIEDSLSGIQAGKASGSKVIGITTTHAPDEMMDTDLVIDNFNALTLAKLITLMR
ncbi:MAG: HAD family phosphatase [Cyclobacteriaceae bacterium]|nr:HAD family phosphatase [Cyclobacteriaceae bacterium]UYN88083.1 MAG: HAD family phosphatase [Cyclobacteriaceae bacterium]